MRIFLDHVRKHKVVVMSVISIIVVTVAILVGATINQTESPTDAIQSVSSSNKEPSRDALPSDSPDVTDQDENIPVENTSQSENASSEDGSQSKKTSSSVPTSKPLAPKIENASSDSAESNHPERYEVLDSGKCGDNLTWELRSNGELRISGKGPMYDYVKYDTERQSPWYKYRNEPYVNDEGTKILNPDGTEYLPTDTYYADDPKGYKIKKIVIDEGVTYIGNWAFYRVCVDELTIPEGVTETGYFCIRFSPSLKTINLPNSLKILDDYGISRNLALETVNIGDSLEKIGEASLQNNPKLRKITLPDSCTEIGVSMNAKYDGIATHTPGRVGVMDNCESLKYVDLGNVKSIPQRAFLNCSSIESVVIPNTVSEVGVYAFRYCSSLKTVTFEANSTCKTLSAFSFADCPKLVSVTGGTALESIEKDTFNNTKAIATFDFSDTNKELGANLFYNCAITEATLGIGITTVSEALFQGSELETLYISKNVIEVGSAAFYCSSLQDVYYDGTLEDWNRIVFADNSWWGQKGSEPHSTVTVHFSVGTSF